MIRQPFPGKLRSPRGEFIPNFKPFSDAPPPMPKRQRKPRPELQLKELILGALSDVGGQRYLREVAEEHPGVFVGLLGKILPTQLTGPGDGPITVQTIDPSKMSDEALEQLLAARVTELDDE